MHRFTLRSCPALLLLLLSSSAKIRASPVPEDLFHGTETYPPAILTTLDGPGPPADYLLPSESNQQQTDPFLGFLIAEDQASTSPDLFSTTPPSLDLGLVQENDPNNLISQAPENPSLFNSQGPVIDYLSLGLGTLGGGNENTLLAEVGPQCQRPDIYPVHTCCRVIIDKRPEGAVAITVNECKERKVSLSLSCFRIPPSSPQNGKSR